MLPLKGIAGEAQPKKLVNRRQCEKKPTLKKKEEKRGAAQKGMVCTPRRGAV